MTTARALTPAEANVHRYLTMCNDIRTRPPAPGGVAWPYRCIEELLLREGQWFRPRVRPARYRQRLMRQCFRNAYLLALHSNGRLSYCEGSAYFGVLPMEHAWCVDQQGRVVDPTWPWGEPNWGLDDGALIGLVFPIGAVHSVVQRHGLGSQMLDNYRDRWPLLRTPWDGTASTLEAVS